MTSGARRRTGARNLWLPDSRDTDEHVLAGKFKRFQLTLAAVVATLIGIFYASGLLDILARWDVLVGSVLANFLVTRIYALAVTRAIEDVARHKWWTLDVAHLKPGDIVGTRHQTRRSRLIRENTGGGPLSHVALFLGGDDIIEAVMPRTATASARRYVLRRDRESIRVLRVKRPPSGFDLNTTRWSQLHAEARYYTPNLYSVMRAVSLRQPMAAHLAARDALICSGLVVHSYRRAGFDLFPGRIDEVSPNDFIANPMLEDVTRDCLRRVSRPEAADALRELRGDSITAMATGRQVLRWLRAFGWAISPARRAWATPMERWRARDFWSFHVWLTLGDLRATLTLLFQRLVLALMFRHLRHRAKNYSAGIEERVRRVVAETVWRCQGRIATLDAVEEWRRGEIGYPSGWPRRWLRAAERRDTRSLRFVEAFRALLENAVVELNRIPEALATESRTKRRDQR